MQTGKPHYVDYRTSQNRFFPETQELIFYIVIVGIASAYNYLLAPSIHSLLIDIMGTGFYLDFVVPLLAGLGLFWIIIARALTHSQIGGTITGILFGIVLAFNTFFLAMIGVTYWNVNSLFNMMISIAVYITYGLISDFCFYMEIHDIIVFVIAGGLAMVARIPILFFSSFIDFQYISIIGTFIIAPISGIVIGGLIGFTVSNTVVNAGFLPFEPSNALRKDGYPSRSGFVLPESRDHGDGGDQESQKTFSPRKTMRVSTPPRDVSRFPGRTKEIQIPEKPSSASDMQPNSPTPAKEATSPIKPLSPVIDKLKLFRNAISRSKNIPFTIATEVLGFKGEKDLISWLWEIDLPGFEIDYSTKMIIITGAGEEVTDAIDKLLEKYRLMEIGGEGKI